MHREESILEETGGILCDYRGHPIKNQLITNLVAGKENIVHDLISQWVNKQGDLLIFLHLKNLE